MYFLDINKNRKPIGRWENHRKTRKLEVYPLVNVHKKLWKITMLWENSLSPLGHGFNSYVKLPKGISNKCVHYNSY